MTKLASDLNISSEHKYYNVMIRFSIAPVVVVVRGALKVQNLSRPAVTLVKRANLGERIDAIAQPN